MPVSKALGVRVYKVVATAVAFSPENARLIIIRVLRKVDGFCPN